MISYLMKPAFSKKYRGKIPNILKITVIKKPCSNTNPGYVIIDMVSDLARYKRVLQWFTVFDNQQVYDISQELTSKSDPGDSVWLSS